MPPRSPPELTVLSWACVPARLRSDRFQKTGVSPGYKFQPSLRHPPLGGDTLEHRSCRTRGTPPYSHYSRQCDPALFTTDGNRNGTRKRKDSKTDALFTTVGKTRKKELTREKRTHGIKRWHYSRRQGDPMSLGKIEIRKDGFRRLPGKRFRNDGFEKMDSEKTDGCGKIGIRKDGWMGSE